VNHGKRIAAPGDFCGQSLMSLGDLFNRIASAFEGLGELLLDRRGLPPRKPGDNRSPAERC